jgi:hypothetical protein
MATPSQPAIETIPAEVTLRLTKSMRASIGEKLSRRNIKAQAVEDYFLELAQADIAPVRLQAWLDKFPPAPAEEKKIETKGRQEVAAARVQRVLHLHEQAISDGNISQRLGLSVMTVRRILKEHAQSDHVQRSGPAGRARSREARFWER